MELPELQDTIEMRVAGWDRAFSKEQCALLSVLVSNIMQVIRPLNARVRALEEWMGRHEYHDTLGSTLDTCPASDPPKAQEGEVWLRVRLDEKRQEVVYENEEEHGWSCHIAFISSINPADLRQSPPEGEVAKLNAELAEARELLKTARNHLLTCWLTDQIDALMARTEVKE